MSVEARERVLFSERQIVRRVKQVAREIARAPLRPEVAVPILAALALGVAYVSHWTAEIDILVAGILFLPLVPPVFRYSRVIWMHFDRVVDPNPESERYAATLPTLGEGHDR